MQTSVHNVGHGGFILLRCPVRSGRFIAFRPPAAGQLAKNVRFYGDVSRHSAFFAPNVRLYPDIFRFTCPLIPGPIARTPLTPPTPLTPLTCFPLLRITANPETGPLPDTAALIRTYQSKICISTHLRRQLCVDQVPARTRRSVYRVVASALATIRPPG